MMTKCPRSAGAEKIHDLILSGLNPHRKQWKNNEQSEQQTLYVLSSLDVCAVMEMRLKKKYGRALQLDQTTPAQYPVSDSSYRRYTGQSI